MEAVHGWGRGRGRKRGGGEELQLVLEHLFPSFLGLLEKESNLAFQILPSCEEP